MRPALRAVLLTQPLRVRVANIVRAAGGFLPVPAISQMTVGRDGSGGAPASGGVVGRIYCATGSGRYAIAPSDAARPTLTVGAQSYLTADGVDDWMNVTPTLNLGEAWWHVGGWRSDTSGRACFSLSNQASSRGALVHSSARWQWTNAAGTLVTLYSATAPTAAHVLTLEDDTNIAARFNGVADVSPFAPYDDSAATQGLALFSNSNAAWGLGIAGRFYGGAFAPGAITASNRAIVERYVAQITGVSL